MEHWKMYCFQYIVGGIIFIIGMIIAFRSGDMKFQKSESQQYVIILILGFFLYAIFHGVWIWAAINV